MATAPDGATEQPPEQRLFRVVGEIADPSGDAGRQVPGYADLVAITISDDGTLARVTVDVAEDLPGWLAEGEVLGIGVDLFVQPDAPESSHQLFADGGSDGWTAYLHTPQGLVEYPGEFRVGGGRLVFELQWSALGDPRSGAFSAFSDWSRRRPVLNETGRDRAPDRGRASYTR